MKKRENGEVNEFAVTLKAATTYLKNKNVSLTKIAKEVGVSVSYMSNLTSGKRIMPSPEVFVAIVNAIEKFGTPADLVADVKNAGVKIYEIPDFHNESMASIFQRLGALPVTLSRINTNLLFMEQSVVRAETILPQWQWIELLRKELETCRRNVLGLLHMFELEDHTKEEGR